MGPLSLSLLLPKEAYCLWSYHPTLLYHNPDALMQVENPAVALIYAQYALKSTEPDWGAMGASDLGFDIVQKSINIYPCNISMNWSICTEYDS